MIGEPVTRFAPEADCGVPEADTGDSFESLVRGGGGGADAGRAPRNPWSERERVVLRTLCEQSLPSSDIAKVLGRTQRAVDAMSLRLGIRRHEQLRPWTDDECALVLRLHAEGRSWAVIADAMPDRSAIAVFRKLRHLVGPAPFKASCAVRPLPPALEPGSEPEPEPESEPEPITEALAEAMAQPIVGPTAEPAGKPPPPRPVQPRPTPPPLAPAVVAVCVSAMVRWLRSRDFMVLHLEPGWRVDHRVLASTEALLEFVNVRRHWLHLPPFMLVEPDEGVVPVVEIRRFGPPKRAHRFGSLHYR